MGRRIPSGVKVCTLPGCGDNEEPILFVLTKNKMVEVEDPEYRHSTTKHQLRLGLKTGLLKYWSGAEWVR